MSELVEIESGNHVPSHSVLLQNDAATALGRLRLAGLIRCGRGVEPRHVLRVYGSFAAVLILDGSGSYRDVAGITCSVHAGDLITVFPERAHWYGPKGAARWDELYVTFDGPLFGLYRQAGILNDRRPVSTASEEWRDSLWRLLVEPAAQTPTWRRPLSHVKQVAEFAALLVDLGRMSDAEVEAKDESSLPAAAEWLSRARFSLDIELSRRIDLNEVASDAGVSYEQFRKYFQREVGVSPARYRMLRRIEAARELLRYSPQITNRQAAATLGFSDEFHFSRRFTELTGVSPRDFRRTAGSSVVTQPAETPRIATVAPEPVELPDAG